MKAVSDTQTDITSKALNARLLMLETASGHWVWNFRWGHYNLKDLIFRLKKKGFVCYFTGSSGEEMWRITDCWQDHYEKKYKASIGCVNANIPAAEPLLDKMEDMFLKTLERK